MIHNWSIFNEISPTGIANRPSIVSERLLQLWGVDSPHKARDGLAIAPRRHARPRRALCFSYGVMDLFIKYFSPLWLFHAAADLSFWQRHQLDARMHVVSRFLWRYVMRWSVVSAMLLVPAALLAHGLAATGLALAGGVSASVAVLMAALALGCLIGSRLR